MKQIRHPGQCPDPECNGVTRIMNATNARVKGVIYRRRECIRCGKEFATYELPATALPDYAAKSKTLEGEARNLIIKVSRLFYDKVQEFAVAERVPMAEIGRKLLQYGAEVYQKEAGKLSGPVPMVALKKRYGRQRMARTALHKHMNIMLRGSLKDKIDKLSDELNMTQRALVNDLLTIGVRELGNRPVTSESDDE